MKKEEQENYKNNTDWFNEYMEVEDFIIERLSKLGLSFPIAEDNKKPSENAIRAIRALIRMS